MDALHLPSGRDPRFSDGRWFGFVLLGLIALIPTIIAVLLWYGVL